MKNKLLLLSLLTITFSVNAQNVGIGTTTPQTKLHIISSTSEALRVEATNPYVSLYSSGVYKGYFWKSPNSIELGSAAGSNLAVTLAPNGLQHFYVGTNGNVGIGNTNPESRLSFSSDLGEKISLWGNSSNNYGFGIQNSLLQIHTADVGADIAFGYGSSTSFTERMRIKGNGNVGIGNTNPATALSFGATLGKKISLYPGATGDAGFGVYGNELRINADYSGADITFGYDNTIAGFTERMRIKGNGNVGIGVSDPGLKLDISGRMRIRTGTDGEAGIWLNNAANTNIAAFLGLENDNYIGFYGGGSGWKFAMNTQTGALKINGSEGQAGKVLQSNGNSAAASWVSSTNILYNNTANVFGTASPQQTFPAFEPAKLITGLTYTFTVAGNAKVLVSFVVPPYTISCGPCFSTVPTFHLMLNGGTAASYWEAIQGGPAADIQVSRSKLLEVGPGTHTIELFGVNSSFNSFYMWGNNAGGNTFNANYMVIQVIPQ